MGGRRQHLSHLHVQRRMKSSIKRMYYLKLQLKQTRARYELGSPLHLHEYEQRETDDDNSVLSSLMSSFCDDREREGSADSNNSARYPRGNFAAG